MLPGEGRRIAHHIGSHRSKFTWGTCWLTLIGSSDMMLQDTSLHMMRQQHCGGKGAAELLVADEVVDLAVECALIDQAAAPNHRWLQDSAWSCAICMCDVDCGPATAAVEGCGHTYHVDCILRWAEQQRDTNHGSSSCPVCKASFTHLYVSRELDGTVLQPGCSQQEPVTLLLRARWRDPSAGHADEELAQRNTEANGRPRPVERRVDKADGNAYAEREFLEHYGGTAEWQQAAPTGSLVADGQHCEGQHYAQHRAEGLRGGTSSAPSAASVSPSSSCDHDVYDECGRFAPGATLPSLA